MLNPTRPGRARPSSPTAPMLMAAARRLPLGRVGVLAVPERARARVPPLVAQLLSGVRLAANTASAATALAASLRGRCRTTCPLGPRRRRRYPRRNERVLQAAGAAGRRAVPLVVEELAVDGEIHRMRQCPPDGHLQWTPDLPVSAVRLPTPRAPAPPAPPEAPVASRVAPLAATSDSLRRNARFTASSPLPPNASSAMVSSCNAMPANERSTGKEHDDTSLPVIRSRARMVATQSGSAQSTASTS